MVDEYELWQVMQRSKTGPAGLALWLTWQMDLGVKDIAALTWKQVDLAAGTLELRGQKLPMTRALRRILEEARRRTPESAYVVAGGGGKPLDPAYLSRLAGALLRREGLPGVTLRTLRRGLREDQEAALLRFAEQRPFLTAADAAEFLGLPGEKAGRCLRSLAERGKICRCGNRYYVHLLPPERRADAVRDYIAEHGFAYRQDIARLLGLEVRQCGALLRRLAEEGELVLQDKKYFLPKSGKI